MKRILLLLLGPSLLYAQGNLGSVVKESGFPGSVSIYDANRDIWYSSDSIDATVETIPASTFKIIHLLIALEVGAISSEKEVIKWPGSTDTTVYGFRPEIYRDMSVEEAFRVSAGWAFIEIAKRIPRSTYIDYLKKENYGNFTVSESEDFWNFGPLHISPKSQIEVVSRIFLGKSGFSPEHVRTLKKVMLLDSTGEYTLWAKTGWGWENNIDQGWWVGALEKNQQFYFFATRLSKGRMDKNPQFPSARRNVAIAAFKELGIINR